MGLFEKIFGVPKNKERVLEEYKPLTMYQPIFTSPAGQIYESDLIRAAINARAVQISKLKVEFPNAPLVKNRLQTPNVFNTWSQFLYRVSTILDVANTCFICPVFDEYGRIREIYPVTPSRAKIVGDSKDPYIAMEFREGMFIQLPVWQVGILTKFQFKNDFFGEDNRALNPELELIEMQNAGIKEGIKSAATIRFMAKLGSTLRPESLKAEQENFRRLNFSADNSGGVLMFDQKYTDVKQVDSKPFVVDSAQMNLIKNQVYDYYQVNEDILQSRAYGDKWVAFYESVVETFAVQFSEVMTQMFKLCEGWKKDACVMATANRLQYMSNNEKLNISAQLADRGILNRDEVREIWNLPPLPDGAGQEYIIRGEYYNASEKIQEGAGDE